MEMLIPRASSAPADVRPGRAALLRFVVLAGCMAFFASPSRAGAADVQTAFNANGLVSLMWQGHEFVHDPTVYIYGFFQMPDGSRVAGAAATGVVFDAVQRRRTFTYPWGTVILTYTPAGSRMNLAVSVTNSTANPLVGFNVAPMSAQFPQLPAGIAWQLGFEIGGTNIDDLTALPADFGTGLLLLCNDQVGGPLRFGFTSPTGPTSYGLRATTEVTGFPDDPAIAPGETRQLAFSFRFAPGGTDPESMIGDLHAALAAQMPRELVWSDRRAIGTVFLSNGQNSASPTNPRGWLNDPLLDTVSPAGRAVFHQQMLAKADYIISNLQQMNAQGMIFWDVEGEEYGNITYAGDPRRIGDLAPEMDTVADRFFAKFLAAGLRTGVCIRPSRIVPGFPGTGHVWDHDNYGFDVLANLSDKIAYAKNRWGCTLFYMDTNVEYAYDNAGDFTARLLRAPLLRDLRRLHPDALIIPELPATQYWVSTAPYREVRGGFTATPARVRHVYPGAFTVIEPKDCDWAANHTALVSAVQSGDILLFRSWFADAGNPQVKAIYDEAHPAPVITSAGRGSVDAGAPFNYTITATNAPVSFGANGRPVSLQLDSASGVISGTAPLLADDFAIVLSASSLWGTGQKTLALHVRGPLEQWRALHFPGVENSAAAADDADPDGDGFANYFEFALGLNPTLRDSRAVAPHVGKITAAGSDWLAISFRRRKAVPPGVNYLVEESTDLATWSAIDSAANQVGTPIDQLDGTELVTIRGTHSPGTTPPAFLRLRISAP